ncbi:tetratricopeptide repeat protein, partial [Streptomyces sviceus]
MEKQATESRRARLHGRVVLAAVAGCAVLGTVLMLLPAERTATRAPGPAPGAQALTAVAAGVSAALPDLAALIGERESRLRRHPEDAQSWAVLGTAYVEQGRRTADTTFYAKAEDSLRTSLKVRRSAEALEGLAVLANTRRDFRTARTWGEEARQLEPRRWTTYPALIDAYTGLGDYKAARGALERLTELRSGPAVMARAAAVYRDRGAKDAAAQLADAA